MLRMLRMIGASAKMSSEVYKSRISRRQEERALLKETRNLGNGDGIVALGEERATRDQDLGVCGEHNVAERLYIKRKKRVRQLAEG